MLEILSTLLRFSDPDVIEPTGRLLGFSPGPSFERQGYLGEFGESDFGMKKEEGKSEFRFLIFLISFTLSRYVKILFTNYTNKQSKLIMNDERRTMLK